MHSANEQPILKRLLVTLFTQSLSWYRGTVFNNGVWGWTGSGHTAAVAKESVSSAPSTPPTATLQICTPEVWRAPKGITSSLLCRRAWAAAVTARATAPRLPAARPGSARELCLTCAGLFLGQWLGVYLAWRCACLGRWRCQDMCCTAGLTQVKTGHHCGSSHGVCPLP